MKNNLENNKIYLLFKEQGVNISGRLSYGNFKRIY